MSTTANSNKRIAKNTLYLYIRMFLVLIINLYISRALLQALGVSDYGTYVVVAGFVTLFGFFNATLASTMQRYYNYAGTQRGEEGLQEVFSTGCVIHLIIAGVTLIVLESFGVWYFYHFLVIPAGRFSAAFTVFHASVISLVLLILQMPFTGLVLSQEHMGYYSLVSIIDIVLKLVVTLSISWLPYDKLSTYGLLLMGISIIDILLYSIYGKMKWRFLHVSRKVNGKLMKSLLSFTGWNLIGTFAYMLKGQGISLLLNNFFGPVVNAARGIAMQVSNAIANFSSNITVAFSPQIVSSVASGDKLRAEKLMFAESKICYALLLILAVPLCLEMDYVLKLWLGTNIPFQTNIFAILMIADALVCTLNTPCTQVTMATGKIRNYEIAATIVNLCLIPVCYIFLKAGFGAVSSFVITVVFSMFLQTVCLVLAHRVFEFNLKEYVKSVVLPCLAITILLPVIPLIVKASLTQNFGRLLLVCFVDVCVAAPLVYAVLLNNKERPFFIQIIRNAKGRVIKQKASQ